MMSHLTLDARAILAYLNELGYRNISAEQLREFMKDLRKLIKYEERLGTNAHKEDYFTSLFQRTTASYRAKQDKENLLKLKEKNEGKKKNASEKSLELQQKRSAVDQKKTTLEQKKSASEQKKTAAFKQMGISDQSIRKPTLEQKQAFIEQKQSRVEQKKSSMELKALPAEPTKATKEQKKIPLESKRDENKLEENKEKRKRTVQVPPLKLPTSPVTSPAGDSKTSCNFSRSTPCECPSYVIPPQRKVLGEAPPALNRQKLKNPFNWFLTGEDGDGDNDKSKAIKQTKVIYTGQRARKGRSKSPKSSKENRFDVIKEPLWEEKSVSSRSRSHSTGRFFAPQASGKALSTPGGNQKKRRSQSSDRPTTRTYTARSMGAMVPQPRLNRGYRSCVNDPVKLYHYYQQEWKYFEKQIPGILTRADVRWQIRQKLLDPQ